VRNTKGLKRGGSPGRPAGQPNKATKEIKAASQKILGDTAYQASLRKRLKAGKAPHMEVLLHHYAYGKPKETVRVEEQPAELRVTILRTKADIELIKGPLDPDAEINDPDDDE
jgi:hypothetical protein